MRSLASRSPCSIRLASSTSSAAVSSGMAADVAQEQLQRVAGDRGQLGVVVADRLGLGAPAVVRELDPAGLERSASAWASSSDSSSSWTSSASSDRLTHPCSSPRSKSASIVDVVMPESYPTSQTENR